MQGERATGRRINSRTGGRINRPTGRQTARHERPDGRLPSGADALLFALLAGFSIPRTFNSSSSFRLLLRAPSLSYARARARLGHPFQLLLLLLTFGRGV